MNTSKDVSGLTGTSKTRATADRQGRLFIVSAPSGTGKTTLCRAVRQRIPDLRYSVSYTTRPPRKGEVDGKDYYFITTDAFLSRISDNRWIEWAKVHGNYYGTSSDDLKSWTSAGKDVLLDIDVCGAMRIRETYPDCITIFIRPPSLSILEARLRNRGTDASDTIAMRLENAEKEMAASDQYDYIIVNDSLDRAIDELESIIRSAKRTGS